MKYTVYNFDACDINILRINKYLIQIYFMPLEHWRLWFKLNKHCNSIYLKLPTLDISIEYLTYE